MFHRRVINIVKRYNHVHCEKNIPQINYSTFFENNEKKLDLIQKQLNENNDKIDKVQTIHHVSFLYTIINTIILIIHVV